MNQGDDDFTAALAALLHGLRYRGLAVGPDDAARVAAAFRHAGDWSRQRRVRALKALLARSDEERLVIDQLAALLFVDARVQAEDALAAQPRLQGGEAPASRAGTRADGLGEDEIMVRTRVPARRRLRWLVLLSVIGVLCVGAWRVLGLRLAGPGQGMATRHETGGEEMVKAEIPIPAPQVNPQVDEPQPIRCETIPPPVAPRWPYALLVLCSGLAAGWVGFRYLRASIQGRNIRRLADSVGPRTYEISYPASCAPLEADPVREAAFHLSAPSQDATAPWLDAERTVRAAVRRAGRLVLRYGTYREHRPVLFIEDVAHSMARWPDYGAQLAPNA